MGRTSKRRRVPRGVSAHLSSTSRAAAKKTVVRNLDPDVQGGPKNARIAPPSRSLRGDGEADPAGCKPKTGPTGRHQLVRMDDMVTPFLRCTTGNPNFIIPSNVPKVPSMAMPLNAPIGRSSAPPLRIEDKNDTDEASERVGDAGDGGRENQPRTQSEVAFDPVEVRPADADTPGLLTVLFRRIRELPSASGLYSLESSVEIEEESGSTEGEGSSAGAPPSLPSSLDSAPSRPYSFSEAIGRRDKRIIRRVGRARSIPAARMYRERSESDPPAPLPPPAYRHSPSSSSYRSNPYCSTGSEGDVFAREEARHRSAVVGSAVNDLLAKLGVLANLEVGDKLDLAPQGHFVVMKPTLYTTVLRTVRGVDRWRTIRYIDETLRSAESLTSDIVSERRVRQALVEAIQGLRKLQETYKDDVPFSNKLKVLIDSVRHNHGLDDGFVL
jgi:hypothetical protein